MRRRQFSSKILGSLCLSLVIILSHPFNHRLGGDQSKTLAAGLGSGIHISSIHSLSTAGGESQLYIEGTFGFFQDHVMGIIGPFHSPTTMASLTALDVGGATSREDVVWTDGANLFFLDLDTGQSLALSPAPLFPVGPLAAIDMVGTSRKELVAGSGEGLFLLDLDTAHPRWEGPLPQGLILKSLAALNIGGRTPRPELIATDGIKVYFLDLDNPAGEWAEVLPQVTFPVDLIATKDFLQDDGVDELLIAVSGPDVYRLTPATGGWAGPFPQRFRITAAALTDILQGEEMADNLRESLIVIAPKEETDIRYRNVSEAAGVGNYSYLGEGHSPGAVFADVDGDNIPDLYLVRANEPNLLYRNNGQGAFTLVPRAAGADDPRLSTGALLADYDNDGDMDIYVINFGERNTLYEKRGGVYVDVTEETDPTPSDPAGDWQEGVGIGIDTDGRKLTHTLAAAWADVNRDGLLDLYVGNHLCCGFPEGERDVLYLNNGDGTFSDITISAGLASGSPQREDTSTQALIFADFNNDRWPDMYLTHKGDGPQRDELFINRGDQDGDGDWDGSFNEYFSTQPQRHLGNVTGAAMGVDVADFDNDGDLDVYLTDVGTMDLYKNTFVENGGVFGLELVEPNPVAAPWFSWGTGWVDADNDGDMDLYVATNSLVMDYFFRNDGLDDEGRIRFSEVTVGAGLGQAWNARGVVFADFDRDGWIDTFVVNRGDTPSALFRNESATASGHHWLDIKLRGDFQSMGGPSRTTRDAIGAQVEVAAAVKGDGNMTRQMREIRSGGHTCASTSSMILHYGLGQALAAAVTIKWPSGRVKTMKGLRVDQLVEVSEADQ